MTRDQKIAFVGGLLGFLLAGLIFIVLTYIRGG